MPVHWYRNRTLSTFLVKSRTYHHEEASVPTKSLPRQSTIHPSGGSRISQRVAQTELPRGCTSVLFCKLFVYNCMKMKEFGVRGHTSLATFFESATAPSRHGLEMILPSAKWQEGTFIGYAVMSWTKFLSYVINVMVGQEGAQLEAPSHAQACPPVPAEEPRDRLSLILSLYI